ncbi:hypothetical protein [Allokutzneria albata]|nr:hypothetical protein [Allokutzneria albata]
MSAELTVANVLAHCGGDHIGSAPRLSRAIAAALVLGGRPLVSPTSAS